MFLVPVAPYAHHAGDGRLPGEASRGRERALHSAADAGLPGEQGWGGPPPRVAAPADHCVAPPQPPQFKLDPRLARLLGIHTQTRSCIIQALWQYIKTNKLQDSHDKEYINCDKYFQQVGLRRRSRERPVR